MIFGDFFQKVISFFSTKHPLEREDFLLDAELAYLILIKGALVQLQETEKLLQEKKPEEAKKNGPISCLYTIWYVSQIVEEFENRLDNNGRIKTREDNKGYTIFNITHIYMHSIERLGLNGDALLHNYLVYAMQLVEELYRDVRDERYKFLL